MKTIAVVSQVTDIADIVLREEHSLILVGQAKDYFSIAVAIGLQHGPAYNFINENKAIIGQLCSGYAMGDHRYLCMAGGRVWYRFPQLFQERTS